ncbi:MAG: hypothetical protein PHQ90_05580 [Sulfuricurvum sp.]|nr:hypothetical protein [Sulfuricurvum sp.]MDD2950083.1 hypothetical protein [Sulfuricurvum sp.]
MNKKIILLIIMLLLGITATASARDIPRTDPERKAILNAARSEPTIRFVVKDLYRSGNFAWLCALKSDNGELRRTDESIEVYAYILMRNKGVWVAKDMWYGFLGNEGTNDCSKAVDEIPDLAGPPTSEKDLKTIWQFAHSYR